MKAKSNEDSTLMATPEKCKHRIISRSLGLPSQRPRRLFSATSCLLDFRPVFFSIRDWPALNTLWNAQDRDRNNESGRVSLELRVHSLCPLQDGMSESLGSLLPFPFSRLLNPFVQGNCTSSA